MIIVSVCVGIRVCACPVPGWKRAKRAGLDIGGETWFLVGLPRTDSPLSGETHFAPKGEINTSANLDSPLFLTNSCSPFMHTWNTPFPPLKDDHTMNTFILTHLFLSILALKRLPFKQASALLKCPWARHWIPRSCRGAVVVGDKRKENFPTGIDKVSRYNPRPPKSGSLLRPPPSSACPLRHTLVLVGSKAAPRKNKATAGRGRQGG